jgi:uncharacterized protein (DUF1778 family)
MNGATSDRGSDDRREGASALSKGRSRIVTFRVSGEEFSVLARASRASGSRSLSAFARDAALDKVNAMQTSSTTLSGDLRTLTSVLAQLDTALQDASKKIRRLLGPGSGDENGDFSETGGS